MSQTRMSSFTESVVNMTSGYVIGVLSQIAVFPVLGVSVTMGENLILGVYFTIVSIVRSYVVRRWFNRRAG